MPADPRASETPRDAGSTSPSGRLVVESAPPKRRRRRLALKRLRGIVLTVRPHQWVKNVFVLAPVVFAKEVFERTLLLRAALAFSVFCLLAGAVYAMNDVADIEADRIHPVKRHRPIASGLVSVPLARALSVGLCLFSLSVASLLGPGFFGAALAYFVLNLAYSLKLKHVAYLDVACIAVFFVLRVSAGGLATSIPVSGYLLLCTALLALFLGFGKRRHELVVAHGRPAKQRAALEHYSRRGLDFALTMTCVATVASYFAYTVSPRTRAFFHSDKLWISTLFVVLGALRFLQIVRSHRRAESPTQAMLRDGPFVAIVLSWVMLVMWMVYRLRPS